jgi:hypothetical protein
VVSQEVVPVETGTADGRSVVETSMRAMAVVLVKPAGQVLSALIGVIVGPGVSPFPQRGLDEPLGFAIGARSIRPGATMANAVLSAEATKGVRLIAGAVVGEHGADADAELSIPGECGLEESGGRGSLFVGQDVGEGDAGVIVDGDMHVLPADAFAVAFVIAVDAVARGMETSELFDVEMEQVSGRGVFVTDPRGKGIEMTHTVEPEPPQDAADGGAAEPGGLGDAHAGPALAAQCLDLAHQLRRGGARQSMRARRTIEQACAALLPITAHPLGDGARTDFELGCSRVQSHTLEENFLSQRLSTEHRQSGILVDVHSAFPEYAIASTQSASLVSVEWTTC